MRVLFSSVVLASLPLSLPAAPQSGAVLGGTDVLVAAVGSSTNEPGLAMMAVPSGVPGIVAFQNPPTGMVGASVPAPITMLPMAVNPLGIAYGAMFDPAICAGSQGFAYMAFIASGAMVPPGPGADSAMCVSKYTSAGWLPPVLLAVDAPLAAAPPLAYRFNDRCDITCGWILDPSHYEVVCATWIKDNGFGRPAGFGDAYFSRSLDLGTTFTPALRISDDPMTLEVMAHSPHVIIDAAGRVHVFWQDLDVIGRAAAGVAADWAPARLFMDTSMDGGATFGPDRQIQSYRFPPYSIPTGPTGMSTNQNGGAIPAAHPTVASLLYVVYAAMTSADNTSPDKADLFLLRSTNGGHTWLPPVPIANTGGTAAQINPQIAVQPNGDVIVAWFDNRMSSAAGVAWDVYITRSTDGGVSFRSDYPVNDVPYAPPPPAPVGTTDWIGEYFALRADATSAYLAFPRTTAPAAGDIYMDTVVTATIL